MPYLKFASKIEREKAREFWDRLARENNGTAPGLVSLLNDPEHGLIMFFSENLYTGMLVKEDIEYELIPKDQILAPYVKMLRKYHPDFSDEL